MENSHNHIEMIILDFPIGRLQIAASKNGIISVSQTDNEIKNSTKNKFLNQCATELTEYFAGFRNHFTVPLDLKGTDFQLKVWKTLLNIPFGETISYKQQSVLMEHPKAIRAIASANGKNPVPILIPCHRIVASNGKMQGFIWGVEKKQQLLDLENSISSLLN